MERTEVQKARSKSVKKLFWARKATNETPSAPPELLNIKFPDMTKSAFECQKSLVDYKIQLFGYKFISLQSAMRPRFWHWSVL